MCRLLCVKNQEPFDIAARLSQLAYIAQNSLEYQGHGWGCAYIVGGEWKFYHNIKPIWEDDLDQFGSTTLLIGHARSAFRDENIVVENNMPFFDGNYVFVFNGELRGVRIPVDGRIGAEKVFNYIKRFDKGDMVTAIRKGMDVIVRRTRYVRAMNIIIADRKNVYLGTVYNENPGYFRLRTYQTAAGFTVSSETVVEGPEWRVVPNNTVERLR